MAGDRHGKAAALGQRRVGVSRCGAREKNGRTVCNNSLFSALPNASNKWFRVRNCFANVPIHLRCAPIVTLAGKYSVAASLKTPLLNRAYFFSLYLTLLLGFVRMF